MAHLGLAVGDPLFGISLLILAAVILVLVAARRGWLLGSLRTSAVILALILALPSGCYALIGTSCYVFGDCP
jgi:hypothetical protein